ncbi:la-related protein 7-like [Salvia splendens]|uniref:la-related protein 7-like n=1 Tax=Salvia splendens TaxID=180675 RepID=UPI001C253AB9|nr:la-related protein 7-like [Salvia splendens]
MVSEQCRSRGSVTSSTPSAENFTNTKIMNTIQIPQIFDSESLLEYISEMIAQYKELSRSTGSVKGKPKIEFYDKDKKKGSGGMITPAKTYNPAADSILELVESLTKDDKEETELVVAEEQKKKKKKKKKKRRSEPEDATPDVVDEPEVETESATERRAAAAAREPATAYARKELTTAVTRRQPPSYAEVVSNSGTKPSPPPADDWWGAEREIGRKKDGQPRNQNGNRGGTTGRAPAVNLEGPTDASAARGASNFTGREGATPNSGGYSEEEDTWH